MRIAYFKGKNKFLIDNLPINLLHIKNQNTYKFDPMTNIKLLNLCTIHNIPELSSIITYVSSNHLKNYILLTFII